MQIDAKLKCKSKFALFSNWRSKHLGGSDVIINMMGDLLKIQSDLNRRPQQMKPENQKSENLEEDNVLGVIEPNPFLASPRIFGPKCSTLEWLGGFRALELISDTATEI